MVAEGGKTFRGERIVGHEVRKTGLRFLVRWKGWAPAHDTWETQLDLLTQHGGRVAVALYRQRRAAVDHYPSYTARVSKYGRQAPLPPLSPADAKLVAASLRDYEQAAHRR